MNLFINPLNPIIMAKGNLVNGPISVVDMKALDNHFKQILKIIQPFDVNLTEDEKKRLPKTGDKKLAFIEKALSYMNTNPEYASGTMNLKEARNDKDTQDQAIQLIERANVVMAKLIDLKIAAGSDVYVIALAYYNNVKRDADIGDATAKEIVDDLGAIFKKSRGSSDEEDDDNSPSYE